jgi:hypothetical protein
VIAVSPACAIKNGITHQAQVANEEALRLRKEEERKEQGIHW